MNDNIHRLNAAMTPGNRPQRSAVKRLSLPGVALLLVLTAFGAVRRPVNPPAICARLSSNSVTALPLAHTLPLDSMESLLYAFLREGCYYGAPGWEIDKRLRDTGPYINKTYFGPHPAVRVFYSPEAMRWLHNGRRGSVPDGAIIIKEMYDPPAVQFDGFNESAIRKSLHMWTVMIRDSAASKDGWFWSFYDTIPKQPVDFDAYPFNYPNSGFGNYCVRCHASAVSEHTFASLRNIAGEAGEPLQYRVDDSWRPDPFAKEASEAHPQVQHDAPAELPLKTSGLPNVAEATFARWFGRTPPARAVPLPPVTHDHVFAGANGPSQFITSDQCMSCHDGQGLPFGPNMFIPPGTPGGDVNLSPFGEWSWSLMGLAGRDPVFYAQLESEQALQRTRSAGITDLCFSCHGVMGQRQLHIDQPDQLFREDFVYNTNRADTLHRYGALAREGISCALCHQVVNDGKPLDQIVTGRFSVSAPDSGISRIYGPFDKPTEHPMKESLGMQPKQSDYIKSARLCGTCHAVRLPVYNASGDSVGAFFEQATYLEWLNSSYRDEPAPRGRTPRTCQSCHMTTHYQGKPLEYRIANVQDQSYPEADYLAKPADIAVNPRKDFARHTLAGANPFVLEMFNQFDSILGVRKKNFMTYSSNGLPTAIANAVHLARDSTARVSIVSAKSIAGSLDLHVRVENLTGHRFPTGVGFRRAFLAVSVTDARGKVLWASGRSNEQGVIVDSAGRELTTEFFTPDGTGKQRYEHHHQCIDGQSQVQIYQELVTNPQGQLTTSFVAIADVVKENRLLPHGWTRSGPPGFEYAAETMPHGEAANDPDFGAGGDVVQYRIPMSASGTLKVRAAMYYQTIPPSYLRDRFATARGKNGDRLAYMTAKLNVDRTAIDGWKLLVGLDSTRVVSSGGPRGQGCSRS